MRSASSCSHIECTVATEASISVSSRPQSPPSDRGKGTRGRGSLPLCIYSPLRLQRGKAFPHCSTAISSQPSSWTTSAEIMKDMMVKNMSFKAGQTLTLVGVAKPDATNFAVNIGSSDQDIVMHINPRFNAHGDENAVVCNSYIGGQWCEELREGGFPFQQGEEFKIIIGFTPQEFLVTLSDGSNIHFPNRIGAEKYSFMSFEGEARITSIEIK